MGLFDFFKKGKDDYRQEPVSPEWHKLYEDAQKQKEAKSKEKDELKTTVDSKLPLKKQDTDEEKEQIILSMLAEGEDEKKTKKEDSGGQGVFAIKSYNQPFFKPIEKNVIVLAVENSFKVRDYKQTIMNIISKNIEDNKEKLFLIISTGSELKSSGIVSYKTLKDFMSKTDMFAKEDNKVDIYDQLVHVKEMFESNVNKFNKLTCDEETYKIVGYNIVFIGSSEFDSKNIAKDTEILKFLNQKPEIKSVKYFCIQDSDTINAAKLGFSLIGHIECNFYK